MREKLTIPHLSLRAAALWPSADAVVDADRRMSFSELAQRMREVAAAFVTAGLQVGDRVALWAPNSMDWIVVCLGIQAAGGVLVPLNTRFRGIEAKYILDTAKVKILVVIDQFLGQRYVELLTDLSLSTVQRTIRIGGQGAGGYEEFVAAAMPEAFQEVERRLDRLGDDDVSDIMFTSGTTGEPKGAVTTHGQTVRTAILWTKATTLTQGDRFLILWPFFHCSGYKSGWVACLAVGAASLPEPTLEVSRLVERVEAEKVTFLPGPPTLFQTLLSTPDLQLQKLHSLRVSITGAASVAPSLITAMRHELQIKTVLTGYGLTETCGTVTMTSATDPPEIVTFSCGKALEGIEIKIADSEGRSVPVGEAGEVVVRGMNVMQGYLDDPVATSEAIEPDGWFHTGDIGILDEQGYLRITDRKKDIFIVGGFNCYPAEIEKMLQAHPAILNVAIIGVADDRLGEVGKAFVVLKPNTALSEPDLITWSRERMANFKVPRYVSFVQALPTTATGKVQKFKLPD